MLIFASRHFVLLLFSGWLVGVRVRGGKVPGLEQVSVTHSPPLSSLPPVTILSWELSISDLGFIILDIIQQDRIESHEISSGWIRRGKPGPK